MIEMLDSSPGKEGEVTSREVNAVTGVKQKILMSK